MPRNNMPVVPIAGADDFCKLTESLEAVPAAQMKGVVFAESRNVRAVKEAVAKKGPLSIGIDASCLPFRFYADGVLNTTECGTEPDSIDHAVMLVGYGQDAGVLSSFLYSCVPVTVTSDRKKPTDASSELVLLGAPLLSPSSWAFCYKTPIGTASELSHALYHCTPCLGTLVSWRAWSPVLSSGSDCRPRHLARRHLQVICACCRTCTGSWGFPAQECAKAHVDRGGDAVQERTTGLSRTSGQHTGGTTGSSRLRPQMTARSPPRHFSCKWHPDATPARLPVHCNEGGTGAPAPPA